MILNQTKEGATIFVKESITQRRRPKRIQQGRLRSSKVRDLFSTKLDTNKWIIENDSYAIIVKGIVMIQLYVKEKRIDVPYARNFFTMQDTALEMNKKRMNIKFFLGLIENQKQQVEKVRR